MGSIISYFLRVGWRCISGFDLCINLIFIMSYSDMPACYWSFFNISLEVGYKKLSLSSTANSRSIIVPNHVIRKKEGEM